ncbi:hypothetical protein DFH09DRAFT_1276674 [Mycena vulgaris]|nr:hypothetical protein DFH09DRAFT_1276674 [Mycena vulgaris]
MCPLQPRYACLQCPPSAPCSVFVESALDPQTNTVVPRLIPTSSSQLCVSCQHPWIAHEGKPCGDPSHINFAFRRAGCTDSKCGGFFADQPRWSFLTICVCLAAWMSHGAVPETPAPGLNSDPAGIAPAWALRTQLSVSAPSPMSAFSGTPPEVTGSVGTRRMASAQRTLPHNQLATTSSAPSNYRGARRSFPAGSNPFGANPTLLVAVYPMVIPGIYEPAGHGTTLLKAQNDNMLTFIHRLQLHNLVLTVSVPRNGIAPAVAFTTQVVDALAVHGLSLPPHPQPLDAAEAAQFTKQPWALLSPTRRNDVLSFKVHPTINANSFGMDEFTKLGKKFKNPDPTTGLEKIILFIAPRFGPLSGAIDCTQFSTQTLPDDGRSLSHPCFASRVIDGLPFAGNAMPPDPECMIDICPVVEREPVRMTTPPPLPSFSLVRPRSSPQSSLTPPRRVRPRQASVSRSVLLTISKAPPTPIHNPWPVLHRRDVRPLVIDRDIASPDEIIAVQEALHRQAVGANIPFTRLLNLHARDVDSAARGVHALLVHLEEHPPLAEEVDFIFPPGLISCTPVRSKASFFRQGLIIRLGVRGDGREVSFGPGPLRAVYRQAINTTVLDKDFWQQAPNSAFHIPVFTPGSIDIPARTTRFATDGSLFAIHCHALSAGPRPISIWLLLALCMGQSSMLVSREFVAAIDPVAFDCLAPWYRFGPEDMTPSDIFHPFNQFLMNVMDIQPSLIHSPRTQAVHDKWTMIFAAKVLLGSTTLWDHPEFRALQTGFDIDVGTTSVVSKFVGAGEHGVLPLLAAMYDRQVRRVEDVASRVIYRILVGADDGTTPYYGAIFRLLFLRYLEGVGHPLEVRGGLVPEEEWSKHVNNAVLRASLLLEAASDNDLLPSGDTWRIQLSFVGCNPAGNLARTASSAETNPRPLHFHTCTYDVDVKITRSMEDMLLSSCLELDNSGYTSVFDLWMHGQLLSRDHNTV